MSIESMYGWLIVVAFAFFIITLALVSEKTQGHLKTQDKKSHRD